MAKEVLFTMVDEQGNETLCIMEFYKLLNAFHHFSVMGETKTQFFIHNTGLNHYDMMKLLDYEDFVFFHNP